MDGSADRIKTGRKFDQVLEGARQVFMADGFERAGVDNIARVANVSKATLYSYFPDKQLLFMEVARQECARQAHEAEQMITPDVRPEEALRIAAGRLLGFILSEFGQRVFRICVAESDRFPDLGRHFYESGPLVVRTRLTTYFAQAVQKGELNIEDFDLAADQFAELCKADLFPRLVFNIDTDFTKADVSRVIDGAVETFMARYGA